MEISTVIKNITLTLSFCLVNHFAISQDFDESNGFVDSIFLNNVYKSAIHTTYLELQNHCHLLKEEDIKINEALSDTIPIFRDVVVVTSSHERLIDFDRIDYSSSTTIKDEIIEEDYPNFFKPFEGIKYHLPYHKLHYQNRKIDIEGCQEQCPIELSFSVLSIQNEIIEGYVYVTINEENYCNKKFEDPLVFQLDNWDNLIITRVSTWWKKFQKIDYKK